VRIVHSPGDHPADAAARNTVRHSGFVAHRTDGKYFFRPGIVVALWRSQEERNSADRSHESVARTRHGTTRGDHSSQPRSLTADPDDYDRAGSGNVAINDFEWPRFGYESFNRRSGGWWAVALFVADAAGRSCFLFIVRRFG